MTLSIKVNWVWLAIKFEKYDYLLRKNFFKYIFFVTAILDPLIKMFDLKSESCLHMRFGPELQYLPTFLQASVQTPAKPADYRSQHWSRKLCDTRKVGFKSFFYLVSSEWSVFEELFR